MMIKHRPIFILIVITILIYLSVDIFYKVVNAKLVSVKAERTITEKVDLHKVIKKPSPDSYKVISERNLFGSSDRVMGGRKQIDLDELESTKLNLALLGTVSGNGKFDYAVIEETDKKKQGLFRVGDTVATATVVNIMRGIVVLRVGDRDEILKMKEGDPGKKSYKGAVSSPKSVTLSKADISHAFKDMNKTLTQVRVRPHFSSGKPDGFMISRIKRGSIFHKMGLKNGDVIQGVNDQPMGSADNMLELYRGLKSGSEIILSIKRRGKQERLKYVFK
ncbi:MAG: PDZ domain-containing protein [Proteobacteria bacterium]|nr:PDZ domain-containing protein [Pseudomonadota bacterium]